MNLAGIASSVKAAARTAAGGAEKVVGNSSASRVTLKNFNARGNIEKTIIDSPDKGMLKGTLGPKKFTTMAAEGRTVSDYKAIRRHKKLGKSVVADAPPRKAAPLIDQAKQKFKFAKAKAEQIKEGIQEKGEAILGRANKYAFESTNKMHTGLMEGMKQNGITADAVDNYISEMGVNGRQAQRLRGMAKKGTVTEDTLNKIGAEKAEYAKNNPGFMHTMNAYKVPQALAAGGMLLGTAGLVSRMFSSRGQQSNAQLYGQQPM